MDRTQSTKPAAASTGRAGSFVIRFCSLFKEGRALTFPCNELGHVDLDTLPERARGNYLFARALVGRDYAAPRVCPAD